MINYTMKVEALFLFLILLLGLVLCSFLGGNCNKEGFTQNSQSDSNNNKSNDDNSNDDNSNDDILKKILNLLSSNKNSSSSTNANSNNKFDNTSGNSSSNK